LAWLLAGLTRLLPSRWLTGLRGWLTWLLALRTLLSLAPRRVPLRLFTCLLSWLLVLRLLLFRTFA
jgi:hypothetical protein